MILPAIFFFNVSFLFALAAFVGLRRRQPQLHRPYYALGGLFTAALTTALSVTVLLACFAQQAAGMMYALAAYAVLVAQFVLFQRRKMLALEGVS